MRTTIWGCRGSLATPGGGTTRYGGNTTCLEIRTDEGRVVVVDAGTGIRPLGVTLAAEEIRHIDLLLTHLHLDHVEGLGFFAPLFDAGAEVRIWGPPQHGSSLSERIRTYLSPPYFPLRFDDLDARIEIVEVREETWQLDGLTVACAPVQHPGSTIAYRFEENGASLVFIPDNEPALDRESGLALAAGADILLHDAQYTQEEYVDRVGWGHCGLDDFVRFVDEADPGRALMFHHDPSHDDDGLEQMRTLAERAADRTLELAAEGLIL